MVTMMVTILKSVMSLFLMGFQCLSCVFVDCVFAESMGIFGSEIAKQDYSIMNNWFSVHEFRDVFFRYP